MQAAQQPEPVSATDRDLLHAIPVNSLPPRRLLQGGEPVAALCEGAVACAERVRQLAWGAADRAAWSPAMSVTSLHQVAAANTVTSHNCQVLLKTMAASAGDCGLGPQSAERADPDLAGCRFAADRAAQPVERGLGRDVGGGIGCGRQAGRGRLCSCARPACLAAPADAGVSSVGSIPHGALPFRNGSCNRGLRSGVCKDRHVWRGM